MSNSFTLDDIKASIEKKYAPFVLNDDGKSWELVSPLRLSKENRKKLKELLESQDKTDENGEAVEGTEEEQVALIHDVLRLVTKDHADSLIRLLGDDPVVLMEILKTWETVTQPGEASNSPS